ncbi:helix-turn-helix domain-containing protein [Arthrobacter gengyunqii]|uniref:Helix-turn-helix domain-containing protein n=1 Tax=Arthrobacter gengyunqii TaxID=2886940 RepID=A0ABS8GEF7_9MICC|nr:helix-turn-helix domain-containing protein [Arthrobacter gengyunqii]
MRLLPPRRPSTRRDLRTAPRTAEIRGARLEHARSLLTQGVAIQTACLASGFLDPGTFGRAFRQRFGVAPSQMPAS